VGGSVPSSSRVHRPVVATGRESGRRARLGGDGPKAFLAVRPIEGTVCSCGSFRISIPTRARLPVDLTRPFPPPQILTSKRSTGGPFLSLLHIRVIVISGPATPLTPLCLCVTLSVAIFYSAFPLEDLTRGEANASAITAILLSPAFAGKMIGLTVVSYQARADKAAKLPRCLPSPLRLSQSHSSQLTKSRTLISPLPPSPFESAEEILKDDLVAHPLLFLVRDETPVQERWTNIYSTESEQ
jgi:hypothetical protein